MKIPHPSPHACGAFTLLELILVMVIVCVMMAMAATSLRGFWAGRRTDDAASQLLAVTHWARSQAATDGRLYRLNIEPRAGTYWLTVQQQEQFDLAITGQQDAKTTLDNIAAFQQKLLTDAGLIQ